MDQTERVRSLYETTLRPRIEALEGLRRDLRSTIMTRVSRGGRLALRLR